MRGRLCQECVSAFNAPVRIDSSGVDVHAERRSGQASGVPVAGSFDYPAHQAVPVGLEVVPQEDPPGRDEVECRSRVRYAVMVRVSAINKDQVAPCVVGREIEGRGVTQQLRDLPGRWRRSVRLPDLSAGEGNGRLSSVKVSRREVEGPDLPIICERLR